MAPDFTRKERLSDGAVHLLGVAASLAATALLLDRAIAARETASILAAAIYGVGLIAMLGLSAAYNLVARPELKEAIRPYDHAAIFLMIAGTYTPFALIAIGGTLGHGLLATVWLVAIAGAALKLLRPRRFERVFVALYLALGWIGLPAVGPLIAALPAATLTLLAAGGLLYTIGVAFYRWERLPHHNTIWHGLVLAAAGCHFLAVLETVAIG